MNPDDPRHGTDAGYSAHLRAKTPTCAECREAHRRENILRQLHPNRKVLAIGSRRRIQALQRLGYSRERIAHEIGYTDQGSLTYIMRADTVTMLAATADRITAVYERLSMVMPTGPGVSRARTWATRFGYAPPLAWNEGEIDDPNARPHTGSNHRPKTDVDEAVVLRLLDGERVPATTAERHEAMRRWKASGRAERELCQRLGWKDARYGRDVA